MKKNNAMKGLLAISAAAAMLASFGAQAQTSATPNPSTQKMTDMNKPAMGQTGTATSGAGMSGSTGSGAGMSGSTGSGSTGMTDSMAGASGAAGATASGSMKMNKADSKAIMDMAMVNMAEVEMGKMAQSKSQNAEVKTFAQQMIDDHTKGLAEVQAVAQTKGVTLPTELDAKHKAVAAKMAKLEGDAFDREYMKTGGVASHKQAHAMLVKNEKSAKDADVKALATKMKPTVEQHLKAAQQMPAPKSGTMSGK